MEYFCRIFQQQLKTTTKLKTMSRQNNSKIYEHNKPDIKIHNLLRNEVTRNAFTARDIVKKEICTCMTLWPWLFFWTSDFQKLVSLTRHIQYLWCKFVRNLERHLSVLKNSKKRLNRHACTVPQGGGLYNRREIVLAVVPVGVRIYFRPKLFTEILLKVF